MTSLFYQKKDILQRSMPFYNYLLDILVIIIPLIKILCNKTNGYKLPFNPYIYAANHPLSPHQMEPNLYYLPPIIFVNL